MVEDEFLTTAQTFTRHLHQAEYHRLQALAKDRNASTVSRISRPTDSTTIMRRELKLQKHSEMKNVKTRRCVDDLLSRAGRASSDSDFSVHSDNEPWQGTHLQSFMKARPRSVSKSLTGLHGVTSHTRAAAGFAKPEKTPTKSQRSLRLRQQEDDAMQDEHEDTDDLDAPVRPNTKRESSYAADGRPSNISTMTKPTPTTRLLDTGVHHKPRRDYHIKRSFLDLSSVMPIPTDTSKTPDLSQPETKQVNDVPREEKQYLADAIQMNKLDREAELKATIRARRERERREQREQREQEKAKTKRVDEIPMFVI